MSLRLLSNTVLRNRRVLALLLSSLAVYQVLLLSKNFARAGRQGSPNILVLLADDLDCTMGTDRLPLEKARTWIHHQGVQVMRCSLLVIRQERVLYVY